MEERKSGILLHITSLPGKYGIGTFGEEACRFVDFLSETKQTYWQILPLGHTGFGNSPYSSYSAFAGNPLLIDVEALPFHENNLQYACSNKVDFEKVKKEKLPLLYEIADIFLKSDIDKTAFEKFKKEQNFWLFDYAFFIALKELHGEEPLSTFQENIKFRRKTTLETYQRNLKSRIEQNQVIQYFFFRQWFKLKSYANEKGIKIIGDIPFYVAGDSADVWVNSEIFMLNDNLTPIKVAGVPPDYFSETGQLWGNPVYDWENSKKTNYKWWKERMKMNLKMFDVVRIDHFRAFSEFWAVPFGNDTAQNGEWLPGPENKFLDEILKEKERIIAEDLGNLSEGAKELLKQYKLPGMKILQFAFNSGASNPFLPHNYDKNCIVYTGTHDNDTSLGVFEDYQEYEVDFLKDYCNFTNENFAHLLMKIIWASVAKIAIAPLQDLLQQGKEHRINIPGTIGNNWEYRFEFEQIKTEHKEFLRRITEIYGRSN
ncbi:MAG: 4-alpha-glucanotransferase [Bacteroidales bacterium]|nr:4-alpha-glucanotransferase [Bacteroidales bacterium]